LVRDFRNHTINYRKPAQQDRRCSRGKELAVSNYEKSLQLNPNSQSDIKALEKLKAKIIDRSKTVR
jgi:hypothetical protein